MVENLLGETLKRTMAVSTEPISANGTAAPRPPATRLPEMPEVQTRGTRVVQRAVGLTFGLLAAGVAGVLLVALLVEIDLTIDARGTLEPETIWPVRSREAGLLADILVASGDTVQQGQVLARLDSFHLAGAMAQLQTGYRARQLSYQHNTSAQAVEQYRQASTRLQAEAALVRAQATLRARLVGFGFGTNVDSVLSTYTVGTHVQIDLALADLRTAEAVLQQADAQKDLSQLGLLDLQRQRVELEQDTAQIRTAKERMKRLTIRAPTSGVVLTEQIERLTGAFVSEGELLFELAELDAWRAHLFVPEREVHEVHRGDGVKVKIDAFLTTDRELFYGRVVSVASEPVAAPSAPAGRYRVTIRLDPQDVDRPGYDKLKRGYSVQGKIITRSGRIIDLLYRYLKERLNV